MEWLARPLICDNRQVEPPLDPAHLCDADLCSICLRMHVILETIEIPRCEGRHIPIPLFDDIDTLESMVLHGVPRRPQLNEWASVIREFGEYYSLHGNGPIVVDAACYHPRASRYRTKHP